MEIVVEEGGKRLDQYVMNETGYSRSKIQKMIESHLVLVNGKESKNRYIVHDGDRITVGNYEEPEMSYEPEKIPLDIVSRSVHNGQYDYG